MRHVYNLGIILLAFAIGWLLLVLIPNVAVAAAVSATAAACTVIAFWKGQE